VSSIRNRERTSLFPLLQIEIDKYRGRWRIFIGEKRVGKTYERKVQAIQAARLIRRAYVDSGVYVQIENMALKALDPNAAQQQ
jgi:hypothetical protein